MARSRGRKVLLFFGCFILLAGLFLAYWIAGPVSIDPLEVSRDVTYVTDLDSEGRVAYQRHIDGLRGEGLLGEENAALVFLPYVVHEFEGITKSNALVLLSQADLNPVEAAPPLSAFLFEGDASIEREQEEGEGDPGEVREQTIPDPNRPWSRDDRPDQAAWIDANQAFFDDVERGHRAIGFFFPLPVSEPAEMGQYLAGLDPVLMGVFELFWYRILARGHLHLGEGRFAQAIRDGELLIRLSRMLASQSHMGLALSSIGEHRGLGILQAVFRADGFDSEVAFRLGEALARLGRPQREIEPVLRVERLCLLGEAYRFPESFSSSGHGLSEETSPRQLLSALNSVYDDFELSFASGGATVLAQLTKHRRVAEDLRRPFGNDWAVRLYFSLFMHPPSERARIVSKEIGTLIASTFAPDFGSSYAEASLVTVRYDLLDASLQVYRRLAETGELPASLEEIDWGDTSEAPRDPFSGASYGYEVSGRRARIFWRPLEELEPFMMRPLRAEQYTMVVVQ